MTLPAGLIAPDPDAAAHRKSGVWGRATLDALFRRNVRRDPDRAALCDPDDRAAFAGLPPRRLSAIEADRIVSALAYRFQELGLKPGSVVALQFPNVVDLPLLILAALRVGLVPAIVPPLWRERELVQTLESLAPKALIAPTRSGDDAPADRMRYVAAALFSVRFVLAVGPGTPDGAVALDDAFERPAGREPRPFEGAEEPGDQPAIVTFRATGAGHMPVARSHNQWIAAGLATLLEARMEPGETVLSAVMASSFGGLATSLLPWLLGGGTWHLHQPIDAAGLDAALSKRGVTRLLLPGAFAGELVAKLDIGAATALRSVIAVHSDPRRVPDAQPMHGGLDAVDVSVFDEWGLIARHRRAGRPAPCPIGPVRHPEAGANGPVLIEMSVNAAGRLRLKGPMVPFDATAGDGWRPTGFLARAIEGGVQIVQRTDHVAAIGGLTLGTEELAAILRDVAPVGALSVTTARDPLFGDRIEVRYTPRDTIAAEREDLEAHMRATLDRVQLAPYKVPSRFVVDPVGGAERRS